MPSGILQVLLVDARGLRNTDSFVGKIDPYVVIKHKSQEKKSSIASGQGKNPVWNEKFSFRVEYLSPDDQCKLVLRIMDKDHFSRDDFVGETTIYLKELIALGMENGTAELHPCQYRVILADQTYYGQIQVGFYFNRKMEGEENMEEFGGWKRNS